MKQTMGILQEYLSNCVAIHLAYPISVESMAVVWLVRRKSERLYKMKAT